MLSTEDGAIGPGMLNFFSDNPGSDLAASREEVENLEGLGEKAEFDIDYDSLLEILKEPSALHEQSDTPKSGTTAQQIDHGSPSMNSSDELSEFGITHEEQEENWVGNQHNSMAQQLVNAVSEEGESELFMLDALRPLPNSSSNESLAQIDCERPRQTYGSVLASETQCLGSDLALHYSDRSPPADSRTVSVMGPQMVNAGHWKDKMSSWKPELVDLTEDSDGEESDTKLIGISLSSGNGDALDKYRSEDWSSTNKKRKREVGGLNFSMDTSGLDLGGQLGRCSSMYGNLGFEYGHKISKSWNNGNFLSGVTLMPRSAALPDVSYSVSGGTRQLKEIWSDARINQQSNFESSLDRETIGHCNGSYDTSLRRTLPPFGNPASMLSSMIGQGVRGIAPSVVRTHDDAFQSVLQGLSLANEKDEATPESGLLAVPLLKHQRLALAWMEKREALQPSGGILADDQGLGKTISTISLILKVRAPVRNTCLEPAALLPVRVPTVELDDDDDDDDDDEEGSMESVGRMQGVKKPDCGIKVECPTSATRKASAVGELRPGSIRGRPAAGTLVVCPTSVLRQWAQEIKDKVTPAAALSVLIYHGSNRTRDPEELTKYDVVLTTYSIVSMEVPKQPLPDEKDDDKRNAVDFGLYPCRGSSKSTKHKKASENEKSAKGRGKRRLVEGESGSVDSGPLARVNWYRVILDEAQSIKNSRTQVARASWGLRAKRRWCLSGTPIQNAIDDLYSYFRFLRYSPFDTYKIFREKIKDRIIRTPSEGYKSLQLCLRHVMLRRTKATLIDGKPIVNLPQRIVNLRQAEFSDEERSFYTDLEIESRKQFQDYAAAGTLQSNYVNILWMLLRLRQACDHPLLVKGHKSHSSPKTGYESARKLPTEERMHLLSVLEGNRAICPICNDAPEEAVVCVCAHVFCRQCIHEQLATGDDTCCPIPKCRRPLQNSLVFSVAALKSCSDVSSGESDNGDTFLMGGSKKSESGTDEDVCWKSSSKIDAVIKTLSSLPKLRSIIEDGRVVATASPEGDITLVQNFGFKVEKHDISLGEITETLDTVQRKVIESTEKAIVFSQWTSMLDLLEVKLKMDGFQYRRLDGTMTVLARDRAVSDFKTLPEVTVMIMSLKAASLGLNMVAACHVLLLDIWWNPTTEDQAIDRAHRIGQTRTVHVSRFTVKNTIEDRILALQERKRQMVASAFGENDGGEQKSRLTMEDLQYLFRF